MFENREQAGELLAVKLEKIIKDRNLIVVPLLRGGIILGKKISDYFNLPLAPLAVKKIGAPLNPELGIGAVTIDKTYYFNENIIKDLNISSDYKETILENKYKEAMQLQGKIEKNLPAGGKKISYKRKNVIVVDDGIAIGNTVICASLYLKKQKVKKIILATPVISRDGLINIKKYFDKIISLKIADSPSSVSEFYKYFPQVGDREVTKLI